MSNTKDTNPKSAYGDAKPCMSLVPTPVMYEVALGFLEGHLKSYRSHNYRVAGCRASTYYNAMRRHMDAWWEGEEIDPKSGMPHITKAICCLIILRDAQMLDLCEDDRPPKHQDGWQEKMEEKIAALHAQYPDPVEPYTQKAQESSISASGLGEVSYDVPANIPHSIADQQ